MRLKNLCFIFIRYQTNRIYAPKTLCDMWAYEEDKDFDSKVYYIMNIDAFDENKDSFIITDHTCQNIFGPKSTNSEATTLKQSVEVMTDVLQSLQEAMNFIKSNQEELKTEVNTLK